LARTVKEENYIARRSEILDASYRLIYTKGFNQMTVQDIIDELEISKGAFYHYFSSKGDVLEALVERIVDEIEPALITIVQDPDRTALEKFQSYFDTAGRWKTAHKPLILSLIKVWYADENAIVRQKVFASTIQRVTPWITKIIYQGIEEGDMKTDYPEIVCQINNYLFQGLGDAFVDVLLSDQPDEEQFVQAERILAAYTESLERILGSPSGSIQLMDTQTLHKWFIR
jgi:TetR/AcrR family transcriptional regulator, transcriptional repressor for nem operon